MKNYWKFNWKHKAELASAIYSAEDQVAFELIPQLEGKNAMPLDFELKRVAETKEGLLTDNNLSDLDETWLDYQPNSLAWPLMSERLKLLIDSNLTGNEKVDWVSCIVKNGTEKRPYFIIRFNEKFDILDKDKTMFVKGTDSIIKPVFQGSKIDSFNIFGKPLPDYLWKITSGIYISDDLKKAIQKEKLTGMNFEKLPGTLVTSV